MESGWGKPQSLYNCESIWSDISHDAHLFWMVSRFLGFPDKHFDGKMSTKWIAVVLNFDCALVRHHKTYLLCYYCHALVFQFMALFLGTKWRLRFIGLLAVGYINWENMKEESSKFLKTGSIKAPVIIITSSSQSDITREDTSGEKDFSHHNGKENLEKNEKDVLGIYFRDGFSGIFSDRFFQILFICLSFLKIKLLLTFFWSKFDGPIFERKSMNFKACV